MGKKCTLSKKKDVNNSVRKIITSIIITSNIIK